MHNDIGMVSSRRNSTGAFHRDGQAKDWSQFADPSPSPKLLYSQSYVVMRGLLASLASLDFVLWSSRLRSTWRSPERSKSKCLICKRVAFRLFVCFLVGIFIGFTPFFSVDVSQKIVSELPFDNGVVEREMVDGKVKELDAIVVQKEVEVIDEPEVEESPPVPPMLDDEVDFVEASRAIPAINDLVIPVRKLLIVVTVTSVRPQQAYYLNRLAHVLKGVPPPLLWLVVEWPGTTFETEEILRSSGVMYRHLVCRKNITSVRKIAVCQRNNAIYHIKKHHLDGIVHFADEERSYMGDVFEEMRRIRRFGTWPVAIHDGSKYRVVLEGPVCKGNRITGWNTIQKKGAPRRFPIGFSGFAFNSTMLWDPQRWNRPALDSVIVHSGGRGGLQESRFIEKLVKSERQIEGLPDNCNRVMVWNFNLEPPRLNYPAGWSLWNNLEVDIPVT
ncbi:probable glucuronosyltransferase Os05g0559600 [Brachypodium distachyon]|uniref:Glycosyltransferases n=1 Tax=Brachypodium distachyon TaxID=15368 RepID=I1HGI4_BRADI|nr:probable glucuronosyltransferase Os05g0559600 [Brachypodium distachyon]KQK04923.1 hypothetical protein BRADI_2g16840v3 [Brachypodium distachyon]KQK04924.1 hypothetical protein BRADI_2g16840v3 [Brachypodium distachyon]|eukprot:XP_010231038.1 probable glucuronosyltransferase Os05g0559600 [Brachypodium distachyon]